VQQALLLLRNLGVLRDAPGCGLEVAPLDAHEVQQMYDMRAVVEALAARRAAGDEPRARRRRGACARRGRRRRRPAGRSAARMAAADLRLHEFVYELSVCFIADALKLMDAHPARDSVPRRTRGQETPGDIWDQHAALMQAIAAGDARRAETLARAHITQAAGFLVERLRAEQG
jgi:DNA-binding GntR family transcriptional regulator